MEHWTDNPHAIMRQHVVSQLAVALDAAQAWLSPREAGKEAAEILGGALDERGEREELANYIERAIALLRKWRS